MSARRDTLTDLQEAFCREYVIDQNATQAYHRACASLAKEVPKSAAVIASKWLKLAKVNARVTELAAQSAERVMAAKAKEAHAETTEELADYVLRKLVENVERAMQETPVVRNGIPTGEYQYDGAVANKALELLGKTRGMFREVVDTHDRTLEDALAELARDERAA